MIWDKIWDCDQFAELSIPQRLLYIALITSADDEGCFRVDAKYLKRKVFYGDRLGIKFVERMIQRLQEVDLIVIGQCKKGLAGFHPNWHQYQTLRKDRSKPSEYSDLLVANGRSPRFQDAAQDKLSEDKISEDKLGEVKADETRQSFNDSEKSNHRMKMELGKQNAIQQDRSNVSDNF